MAIAIRGIRVEALEIKRSDTGDNTLEGRYSLISTADKVLATQSFNGYNDIKVSMSVETQKAFNDFIGGMKKDIQVVLGLTEE